ncbi:hypothetical protein ACQP1W_33400 [Spirillospora sp. CA-255316]
MVISTKLILRKTRTAADYVHTHSPNLHTRCRAEVVLRQLAAVHAAATVGSSGSVGDGLTDAPDWIDPAALRALLTAVADCAGTGWLHANAHDPDIGRLTALLDTPHPVPGDPAELDELLATVLWARHGPQPAPG